MRWKRGAFFQDRHPLLWPRVIKIDEWWPQNTHYGGCPYLIHAWTDKLGTQILRSCSNAKRVSFTFHSSAFCKTCLVLLAHVTAFRNPISSNSSSIFEILFLFFRETRVVLCLFKLFDVLLQAVNFDCLPDYKKKINVPVFRAMAWTCVGITHYSRCW